MKLKFLMALAAAVSLAGLGSLSDTASAQHPGWGGGNGGYGGGYYDLCFVEHPLRTLFRPNDDDSE